MTDDLKMILEDLKRDYLKNLPAKIKGIEELWKASEIDRLETEFHKLKGTGKTYGLPEISELGILAEELSTRPQPVRDTAVPLALTLLRQILDSRLQGLEKDLKHSKEYQELTALEAQSRTAT